MTNRSFIRFALNGNIHEVEGADVTMMLADYLRQRLLLTGTKIVCAEGDCGACTVLRSFSLKGGRAPFDPINSCITMLIQLDGAQLLTVEALANKGTLSPVQQSMVNEHGSQCGYCTPGFVMALTGLLDKATKPLDAPTVRNHLTGNLCRCTGYTPIIDAGVKLDLTGAQSLHDRFVTPAITKALKETLKQPIAITTEHGQVMAPTTIDSASALLKKYPNARLLGSGTDLGVQINKGKTEVRDLISLHLIPDLYESKQKGSQYAFGAKVNLEEVRRRCEKSIPEFSSLLHVFASPQIKNSATLVGNIANASPIGDTLPFLLVSEGEVAVAKKTGKRSITMTELFKGYRQLALKSGEWISGVSFRAPAKNEVLRLYKAATRKDLDISTVSAAFLFAFKNRRIQSAKIALGGVAAVPLRVHAVEEYLENKPLEPEVMQEAQNLLQEAIKPLNDHRGSSAYRRLLVQNFFQQYWQEVSDATVPS